MSVHTSQTTKGNRRSDRAAAGRAETNRKSMIRAIRYLLNYPKEAFWPYLFLIIATISQLAVPRLIRNVIDTVTNGVIAKTLLQRLPAIPQAFMSQALPQVLKFLNLPTNWF